MGRRSVHTPEELRELILQAATDLIESGGLVSLSAREIARAIGYSPGTLYNVFENLDDLVLTVEARLLDRLSLYLKESVEGGETRQTVHRLARAYLRFTHENPRLWNLLFEHHMPADRPVPPWYQAKLDYLLSQVEDSLAPLIPDEMQRKRAARVLWAGVHGITSLSTAEKLANVTTDAAGPMIDDLVENYLSGIERGSSAA
jgi:AcrR family transcriptional regulator